MSTFRLYRKFYVITHTSGIENYSLINPVSLSASTYFSNSVVESDLNVIQESNGIYYVSLNALSYSSQNIYELRWSVQYNNSAPNKNLQTFFTYESTINQLNVFGEISYQVEDTSIFYEVQEQSEIIIEIANT